MQNLEEPPPLERRKPVTQARPAGPSWIGHFVWLAVVLTAGTAGWLMMDREVSALERDLAAARADFEDAAGSLRLLWTTTVRLDESQGARQDLLQDSINVIKSYVNAEVERLWQTAYLDHERRLNQSADRIRGNTASIRYLQDAAARSDARLAGLLDENRTLAAALRVANDTAAMLRRSLVVLSGQLAGVQAQFTATRADQAQIAGRIDGVEGWVGEFRAENLSAGTVKSRLASLVADVRAVSQRVDSLRMPRDTVRRARAW